METSKLASFGKRFLAFILDVFVVIALSYLLSAILLAPFGGLTGAMGLNDFQFGEDLVKGAFVGVGAVMVLFLTFLSSLILAFLYDFIMLASSKHATLGKIMMNIKVMKADGNEISIFEALIRTIVKFVSASCFIFLWLICLFSSKRQNLHDMIISSIVVSKD